MREALLLFSIGPVQSFINHSRKTRDLYAGSYLLSYLMAEVIKELENNKSIEMLFPISPEQAERGQDLNIPNRLVARVVGYDTSMQRELGAQLEQFVRSKFEAICLSVFKQAGVSPNEIALSQIREFLEVSWVFQESESYAESYIRLVQQMHSVKRLRVFAQTNEPAGRKCTLYSSYNAVFVKRRSNRNLPKFAEPGNIVDVTDVPSCKSAIKPGEGLSAIAFVKRMLYLLSKDEKEGAGLHGFQSNATSVAYMLLCHRLGPAYEETLAPLKDEASEALFDLQNNQRLTLDEYSNKDIDYAEKLYEKINGIGKISPYYAVVKLDGDSMGSLYQYVANPDIHRNLSHQISEFASEARRIIQQNDGLCIYAGGEDILAFLPLPTLFHTMLALREAFPRCVKAPPGYSKPLTFSAGITIAHLMEPLYLVLPRTEQLEDDAKSIGEEKNAFALELRKRSGEHLNIRNTWGHAGEPFKALHEAVQALAQQQYAKSFVYNLVETLRRLEHAEDQLTESMVHVLMRQAIDRTDSAIAKDELITQMENMYNHFSNSLSTFLRTVEVALFLAREVK